MNFSSRAYFYRMCVASIKLLKSQQYALGMVCRHNIFIRCYKQTTEHDKKKNIKKKTRTKDKSFTLKCTIKSCVNCSVYEADGTIYRRQIEQQCDDKAKGDEPSCLMTAKAPKLQ